MPPHEGLTHLKEYDIKDSNIELIGTEIDHRVKYNSAATEPAWNNGTVGQVAELYIWRIEDFEVVVWPKEKAGRSMMEIATLCCIPLRSGRKRGRRS
jgi:gelsolin